MVVHSQRRWCISQLRPHHWFQHTSLRLDLQCNHLFIVVLILCRFIHCHIRFSLFRLSFRLRYISRWLQLRRRSQHCPRHRFRRLRFWQGHRHRKQRLRRHQLVRRLIERQGEHCHTLQPYGLRLQLCRRISSRWRVSRRQVIRRS